MTLLPRCALPLIVGLATLAAMAGAGTASAAPVAGTAGGSAGSAGPQQTTNTKTHPQLTTNTAAGCNTKPKKGHARCLAVLRTPADHAITPFADQPPTTALGPADIQDAYKLPDTGDGQTVAIVDAFGYSTAEQDLAAFRSYHGLPPCTTDNGCFTKVDQRGDTDYPPDNTGWAVETALDVDAVSSACPKCHILLVEGDDNSFASLGTAVDTAVSMGAKYVSNSYGGGPIDGTAYDHYYDHPGVAVTAASGDTGNVTDWPSTNPNVVAVGGTYLTKDTSLPRGWDEVPWTGGGSGCTPYEPKPDYQKGVNTDCDTRATADIAADADPASGLGIYDTLNQPGWLQVGGTSLATPLLAAMYALAGEPTSGTYPVTYPYQTPGALFDITEGSNGNCGTVLCTAGPGWDGPTGLGTPNGVAALTLGPYGDVTGHVTDQESGAPIVGATVSTDEGYRANTDKSGDYDLTIPVGTYDVTAHGYGYGYESQAGVQVTEGKSTQVDFTLARVPDRTLSGTVTDGSGHGWPLYAKVTIHGYPYGAIFTDPYTGHYSVNLPQQATYLLDIAPVYPGYLAKSTAVQIDTSDRVYNVELPVDLSSCDALGYAWSYDGTYTGFTGWTTPQGGWTVTDNNGSGAMWAFGDPDKAGNRTGGTGGFANIAPFQKVSANTDLVSPVVDLTDKADPEVGFDTYFLAQHPESERVDLSLDGGKTWQKAIWQAPSNQVRGQVSVPIPQATGDSTVRVRFHFDNALSVFGIPYGFAQIDDVYVGKRTCELVHGGLMAGIVHDGNTSDVVDAATVASADKPGESGTSAATPKDPNLADGYYWMFSSLTGSHQFTATDGRYVQATALVNVTPDTVNHQDWTLQAGHLTVTPDKISTTETLGTAKATGVTVSNDGAAPVHLRFGERNGAFTPMTRQRVRPTAKGPVTQRSADANEPMAPSLMSWTDIADYPIPVTSSVVASHDGKIYSVGGASISPGVVNSYVYDPSKHRWSRVADAPQPLVTAAGGFVDGTLYVAGGQREGALWSTTAFAYHPLSDKWSTIAPLPTAVSEAGAAVLDGRLYVVGGQGRKTLGTRLVYRYNPASDSWTRLADYPALVSALACAGIAGEVVCAGGYDAAGSAARGAYLSLDHTYVYHPASDTWTQGADMPYPDESMASSASNGRLQLFGGLTGGPGTRPPGSISASTAASEYDPVSNAWSRLPNLNHPVRTYGGGGACGVVVGGSSYTVAREYVQALSGYDQCNDAPAPDVPWTSESTSSATLAPGTSVTITVKMDSSIVSQPGDYAAGLTIDSDSPYVYEPVGVTMHVTPPATSGKIAGTVTNAASGDPVAGVTVQLCANYNLHRGMCGKAAYTVKTDKDGHYQRWLGVRYSPVELIAAKDGYVQQVRVARLKPGKTVTANVALVRY